MKAHGVVERGEEGTLCDPGSELLIVLLGGSAGVMHIARVTNRMKKKKKSNVTANFPIGLDDVEGSWSFCHLER